MLDEYFILNKNGIAICKMLAFTNLGAMRHAKDCGIMDGVEATRVKPYSQTWAEIPPCPRLISYMSNGVI